jgi:hypothetical protein
MDELPASLRYVVLRHEGITQPHFDLLFEVSPGSPLASWRSEAWPLENGSTIVDQDDHRPAYLDYEGPVSGGRGEVQRVSAGLHRVHLDTPEAMIVVLEDGTMLHLGRGGTSAARVIHSNNGD